MGYFSNSIVLCVLGIKRRGTSAKIVSTSNRRRFMDRELSQQYAEKNDVPMASFLSSIAVFHEVICQEYPGSIQDHPHIELCDDGSGSVVSFRTWIHCGDKYPHGVLFTFRSLPELVSEADRLMEKYGIKWN
jgi:hypothetical protein